VAPVSPAAIAGVNVGNLIVAVDGRSAGGKNGMWQEGPIGQIVRLRLANIGLLPTSAIGANQCVRLIMIYGPTSTANEVLDGRRLTGKRILVTGVSSGVGLETARALASHGAIVVGAVRDLAKGATAMGALGSEGSFRLVELNLSSLESVNACGAAVLAEGNPFDLIIANAGVMAVPFGLTVDGFETHFATNYLGHYLLVNRMAGLLHQESRVVMVSSAGHRGADVDLEDPNFERKHYDPLVAYRQSKTATILFAVEFDRRYKDRGIRAAAVHPGAVLTETTQKLIDAQPSAALAFTWMTVAQGAATSVWAGCVASADEVGGHYAEDCHVAEVNDDPIAGTGVRSYALDPDAAKALWLASEKMVGEAFQRRMPPLRPPHAGRVP